MGANRSLHLPGVEQPSIPLGAHEKKFWRRNTMLAHGWVLSVLERPECRIRINTVTETERPFGRVLFKESMLDAIYIRYSGRTLGYFDVAVKFHGRYGIHKD
jgi:hypothetical protein